jgi:hypothetical protein
VSHCVTVCVLLLVCVCVRACVVLCRSRTCAVPCCPRTCLSGCPRVGTGCCCWWTCFPQPSPPPEAHPCPNSTSGVLAATVPGTSPCAVQVYGSVCYWLCFALGVPARGARVRFVRVLSCMFFFCVSVRYVCSVGMYHAGRATLTVDSPAESPQWCGKHEGARQMLDVSFRDSAPRAPVPEEYSVVNPVVVASSRFSSTRGASSGVEPRVQLSPMGPPS